MLWKQRCRYGLCLDVDTAETLVTLTDMDVSFTKDRSDRLDRHLNYTEVSQPMDAILVYILIPIIYQNNAGVFTSRRFVVYDTCETDFN